MPTATPPEAANQALATRENQGNLAPAENGGRFLSEVSRKNFPMPKPGGSIPGDHSAIACLVENEPNQSSQNPGASPEKSGIDTFPVSLKHA